MATRHGARAAVILAAGKGTRMKSERPKVLHEVAGRPMLGHVIAAARGYGADRIIVVTAGDAEDVRAYAQAAGCLTAIQEPQNGTGHALLCAAPALAGFAGTVVAFFGDTPLVGPGLLDAAAETASNGASLAVVAFHAREPGAYGRVVVNGSGHLDRIVEAKDADAGILALDLCNSGIMAGEAALLLRYAGMLSNANAQREYYMTDIPALAKRDGRTCAVLVAEEADVMGVNSQAELAAAEAEMQRRLRAAAMANGVTMQAPDTVFLSADTVLEPDVIVGPYVVFGPGVTVRRGAEIRAFSHLEGAEVGARAVVGPFARLRPGARLADNVHIGNFVEVKNAEIGAGTKANHLTYLGDARVGAGANIGAGTITCNYDGYEKHVTEIGAGAFIGSNTALVAPVAVGEGAYVGAGSVVTHRVAKDALGVTRAEQKEIAGWAARFRARKGQAKAKKKG